MEPINISQSVNITCACEHPFQRSFADGPAFVGLVSLGQVVARATLLVGALLAGSVAVALRVAGPVLYFAGEALCLVGTGCKRLAPGLSAVGEGVGEIARLGTGD